jgi:hypothetical protein
LSLFPIPAHLQFLSTLIAVFGFDGYDAPPDPVTNCQFCSLSTGTQNSFFSSNEVPLAETESAFTASVIGALGYAIVAWVWAAIWYLGLDPLKWVLMYMMDEEGIRGRGIWDTFYSRKGEHMGAAANIGINKMSASRVSASRVSMGRVSLGGYQTGGIPGVGGRISASPAMLARASVVAMKQ